MRVLRAILAAATVAIAASPSLAQAISDPTAPEPTPKSPLGGGPPSPNTFTASYTVDLLANLDGGKQAGEGYVDMLKLSAAYDGATAGHDGLTALISINHHNGTRFSGEVVGDAQVVSSLEAPQEAFRLYEAWVQREILDGRAGLKGGLIDLNSTFDVQETAALFLNSSHGMGPELSDTGLNGPSTDPTTALAVIAVYRPSPGWTAQFGLFDGVAGDPNNKGRFVAVELSARDGALLVAQLERRVGDAVRMEAGAWTYTAAFNALDRFDEAGVPLLLRGNSGLYGLVEGKLLATPHTEEGGLSGWARVGVANGDINRVDSYLGAGLVYTGLFPGRDKDQAGVAIARAGIGAAARQAAQVRGVTLGDNETTLEATYRYVLTGWLNIQPDIQYVIHPGADQALGNAVVVGVRLAFTASR